MIARLLLTGMSGAGKSTVGRHVAEALGWRFIDMDDQIEHDVNLTIPEIFASKGEPAFRALESQLLQSLLSETKVVVSTGGGAVCNDAARDAVTTSSGTLTVRLHASAEELLRRVNAHNDATRTTARPMLDSEDQLARMHSLLDDRQAYYSAADVTIPVGHRATNRTVADLIELVRLGNEDASVVELDTGSMRSEISVGPGIAQSLPDVIAARWPNAQAIWIGADENVLAAHSAWIESLQQRIKVPIHVHAIRSGETSKSLESYGSAMDWLLEGGVQRGDVVVAFGGGVVGDLMGFVAATALRGLGLVQMPTTLLSMVDSSVGGKTGINHPSGKNLIGSFYQPPVVLVDSGFLQSVPARELRSGFGEVIKHGLIQASTPNGEGGFLSEVLRLNAPSLLALQEPVTSWLLRQNVSLKASVVAEDEKEANLRQILNFGHTIGHGVEAAGYTLLHGEAIAVGLAAVGALAESRGDIDAAWRGELLALLEAYQLPTSAQVSRSEVLDKMRSDKKKNGGKQSWVLPRSDGGVYITTDVADDQIFAAIDSVLEDRGL